MNITDRLLLDGNISNATFSENSTTVDDYFAGMNLSSEDENSGETTENDNVQGTLTYITQELHNLGVLSYMGSTQPVILDFQELTKASYNLLQLYYQRVKQCEETMDRQMKLTADFANLQLNNRRLKDTLEQKERVIAMQQENERSLMRETRGLTAKIKSNKDEIRKLNSVILSRDNQYRSELRKSEIQQGKLKDKLCTLLVDKNVLRRAGIDITKQLPRKDGSRGKWNLGTTVVKSEDQMHQTLINTYEKRCAALMEENNGNRTTLLKISKKFEELCQLADIFIAAPTSTSVVPDTTMVNSVNNDVEISADDILKTTSNENPNKVIIATICAQLQKLETFMKRIVVK